MWHPATLLVVWISFALLLQAASPRLLFALFTVSLVLSAVCAAARSFRLLRRSRWLLLSIALLFLFFSPGEYLPGLPGQLGMTYEGIERTGEQLGRLLAILLSLALLHEHIGTPGLLAGLYRLLGPFSWRDTTVVRLMLVLEFVDEKREISWREWLERPDGEAGDAGMYESFMLAMPQLRWWDLMLMGGLLVSAWLVAL